MTFQLKWKEVHTERDTTEKKSTASTVGRFFLPVHKLFWPAWLEPLVTPLLYTKFSIMVFLKPHATKDTYIFMS